MTWWRMSLYNRIEIKTKHRALLLADGPEAIELVDEINNNDRYNYYFVRIIDEKTAAGTEDFQSKLLSLIEKEKSKSSWLIPNGQYITAVLPKYLI